MEEREGEAVGKFNYSCRNITRTKNGNRQIYITAVLPLCLFPVLYAWMLFYYSRLRHTDKP